MIFSEDRLYGWGASNITMPRVAVALHTAGPRRTGEIPYYDRRRGVAYRWHSSSVFRIFVDDYPWSQSLLFGALFTVILASIYIINGTLPRDQNVQLTRPVEIIVALSEEKPQKIIPPVETKSLEPSEFEKIEPAVTTESVTEEPDKDAIARPKEVKQDVYKTRQEKAPESPAPYFGVKQRFPPQRAQEPQKMASAAPLMKRPAEIEKITISPPAVSQRNYREKDAVRISQPRQASEVADIISKKNNKAVEDIVDTGRLQRRYNANMQNNESTTASQPETTTDIFTSDRLHGTAELTLPEKLLADRRYGSEADTLLPPAQTAPLSANQQVSFQHQRREEITKLKPQQRARSFTKQSASSLKAMEGAVRADSFPATREQAEFSAPTLSKSRQSGERYTFEKNDQYQFRAPQRTEQEISFQSQKREEKQTLVLPVAAKPLAKKSRAAKKSSNYLAKAPNFSETIIPDEIDPSELISLKEFNVCKDPEKEFRQKTQLAVHLHQPSRIKAGGVLFFFKYTESGYTIEIDIYNPQGRPFKDRCEVLELAIDSIVNRVN